MKRKRLKVTKEWIARRIEKLGHRGEKILKEMARLDAILEQISKVEAQINAIRETGTTGTIVSGDAPADGKRGLDVPKISPLSQSLEREPQVDDSAQPNV